MKTSLSRICLIFGFIFFNKEIFSQTRTVTVTGNQNWTSLFSTPTTSSEDIIILTRDASGLTLTINLSQVNCNSLTIGESNNGDGNRGDLNLVLDGNTLNVANSLTFNRAGEDLRNRTIDVGSGTLIIGSNFSVPDNPKTNTNTISISTGTLKVGGAWTLGEGAYFSAGSGLVEFTGANQTLPNLSYADLSLSGSGIKTFPSLSINATPTVTDNPIWTIQRLKVYSNVTLSLSYTTNGSNPTATANRAYRVNMLYLWENGKLFGQEAGFYGGTGTRTSDPFTALQKTAFGASTGVINAAAAAAALPVTFNSFTAKPTPDNKVSLGWVTSTEQVNKGFRIERQSGNENGKFEQLGFVGSKAPGGNSQTPLYYSFTDEMPSATATNFYRLAQQDLDGKISYSEVRSLKLGKETVTIVSPNPSNGAVNISRTADGKKMNIQVIDQSGKIISQVNNITDANYKLNMPLSGVYTIKLTYPETGEQSIQRIVVQK